MRDITGNLIAYSYQSIRKPEGRHQNMVANSMVTPGRTVCSPVRQRPVIDRAVVGIVGMPVIAADRIAKESRGGRSCDRQGGVNANVAGTLRGFLGNGEIFGILVIGGFVTRRRIGGITPDTRCDAGRQQGRHSQSAPMPFHVFIELREPGDIQLESSDLARHPETAGVLAAKSGLLLTTDPAIR